MPSSEFVESEYRSMWLFAMFDLPVKTKQQRRAYSRFRNLLLQEGFCKIHALCFGERFVDPLLIDRT